MMKRILLLLLLLPLCARAEGFAITDAQGKVHSLADYRGKWVLVNFWATWCSPCLDEIPDLVALHDAHKDKDLVVIGVALDYQDAGQVLEFADKLLIRYPVVLGSHKMAEEIGGEVLGLPTNFLFSPTGKLIQNYVGAVSRASVERYIREMDKVFR